jgi:hypothetical protein
MGIADIQVQVQQLVDDTVTVLNSPSQAGLDALAEAAAQISEKRAAEFQSAADLYRNGDEAGGLALLRDAAHNAENMVRQLFS